MNINHLKTLDIDQSLQEKLQLFLVQFNSYRIGNDTVNLDSSSFSIAGVVDSIEEDVNVEEVEPKKKRFRFLERLFLTEYNDQEEN